MFYKRFLRDRLFRMDPEDAHERALRWAARLSRWRVVREMLAEQLVVRDDRLRQRVFGIEFPNPVGLAAGFDKSAVALNLWPALGFGFLEIGSVTAEAQPGNERPRLFRLEEEQAIINRMGFNNDGAHTICRRIPPWPHAAPIGINVGKSLDAELTSAAKDYLKTTGVFHRCADFIVINVSSPNTPGLRKLQDKELLTELLAAIGTQVTAPILLKIAPDLTFEQMDDVLGLVRKHGVAGIVATNTTVNHPTPPEGGLSGAPLRARATECVRYLWRQTQGKLPIIGVGGVFTAEDAYEKILSGASLVEVWTGMIYEGPTIARDINRGLLKLLARDGLKNIGEAVGSQP